MSVSEILLEQVVRMHAEGQNRRRDETEECDPVVWGKAEELGLAGLVKNLDDGSVSVVAEGPQDRIQELLDWLKSDNAPGRVERVEDTLSAAEGGFRGFNAR